VGNDPGRMWRSGVGETPWERQLSLYFNALWPGDTQGSYTLADWLRRFPHVQITKHGIFRYRRRVPGDLIAAAAKREILVSLKTKDRSVAELRLLEVHLQVERWLRSLNAGAPAAGFQSPIAIQSPGSEIASFNGRLTKYAPIATGSLKITDALSLYLKDKETEFNQYVGRNRTVRLNEKDRVIRYLVAALGEDKELSSLTKNDARTFKDHLTSKGLKAGSVQKVVKVCAAILQVGLDEAGLNIPNPFHRLRLVADVSPRDARLPLSREEIRLMLRMPVNEELELIRLLLIFTGARLNEIAGLQWEDVVFPSPSNTVGYVDIRTNAVRRLKTTSSVRKAPLLPEALSALASYRASLRTHHSPDTPVFPRYGRPGGSDAASAALMKALRKSGVTDSRKSIHSIRHSVKQELRDIGCPKDIRDAIKGHASNSISENYGLGHSLSVMYNWLQNLPKPE